MPSIQKIKEMTSFVEVYEGAEMITVYYKLVDGFTLDDDATLAETARKGKARTAAAGLIDRALGVITSWNLTDDSIKGEDKTVPLTKEALTVIPGDILTDILKAIRADKEPPGN